MSEQEENFERFRLNKASGQNLGRSTLVFVLLYLTRVMVTMQEKDLVIRQGRYNKLDGKAKENFPRHPALKLNYDPGCCLSGIDNCVQNYSLRQVSKRIFIFRLPYLLTWKFCECFCLKVFCQEFGSWWTQHNLLDCSSWPLYSKDDPC